MTEMEPIPNDVILKRKLLLIVFERVGIEPKYLQGILADGFLSLPVIDDLPKCPDVGLDVLFLLITRDDEPFDLKEFVISVKDFILVYDDNKAQQFGDFIDALFHKYGI